MGYQGEGNNWRWWLTTFLEFLGLVGLAIYAWLTNQQWKTADRQTTLLRSQVGIMQAQLESTDRPWVEITKAEVKRFFFHRRIDNGKSMLFVDLRMDLANVGHAIATNIRVRSVLIFQNDFEPNMLINQRLVCESPDILHITPKEFMLFPGRDRVVEDQTGVGYDETIQDEAVRILSSGAKYVSPAIMGCVTYDIPEGHTNPHHTGFSYEFSPRRANGTLENRLLRIGEVLPAKSIVLTDNYLSFSHAN